MSTPLSGRLKMCQRCEILSRDGAPEGGWRGVASGWLRFRQDRPEIADQSLGINGARFPDPNRI